MVFGHEDVGQMSQDELKHTVLANRLYKRKSAAERGHYLNLATMIQKYTHLDEIGPSGKAAVFAGLYHGLSIKELDAAQVDLRRVMGSQVYEDMRLLIERYRALPNYQTRVSGGFNPDRRVKTPGGAISLDNLRSIFREGATDPRIFVIRAIDRFERLQNSSLYPRMTEPVRNRYAVALRDYYGHVAHQGNLYELATDMEEVAFRTLRPRAYDRVRKAVDRFLPPEKAKSIQEETMQIIESAVRRVYSSPEEADLVLSRIQVRQKGVFSAFAKLYARREKFWERNWDKITRKEIDEKLHSLHDLVAFRVILPNHPETGTKTEYQKLYQLRKEIVDAFSRNVNKTKRFEGTDYVIHPKKNNYQSLHLEFKFGKNDWREIQIRTEAMHGHAEYGTAHHGLYKGISLPFLGDALLIAHKALSSQSGKTRELHEQFQKEVWRGWFVHHGPGERKYVIRQGHTFFDTLVENYPTNWHQIKQVKFDGALKNLGDEVPPAQGYRSKPIEFIFDSHRTPYEEVPKRFLGYSKVPATVSAVHAHWRQYPVSVPAHLAAQRARSAKPKFSRKPKSGE